MWLGVGLSLHTPILRASTWVPADLGASLLAIWDAEDAASLTLDGANVTAWADGKNAYTVAQGTAGFQPLYSATSFNGRPGITFDATDDRLELAPSPLPSGATPCEAWALVDQTLPGSTGTERSLISWGNGNNDCRRIRRSLSGANNRLGSRTGSGAASITATTSGDFSGRCIARLIFGATQTEIGLNGAALTAQAVVPATATTRVRLGATEAATALNFFGGVMNCVIITDLLTTQEANLMLSYLNLRR